MKKALSKWLKVVIMAVMVWTMFLNIVVAAETPIENDVEENQVSPNITLPAIGIVETTPGSKPRPGRGVGDGASVPMYYGYSETGCHIDDYQTVYLTPCCKYGVKSYYMANEENWLDCHNECWEGWVCDLAPGG
ncbi:MAG: hypothetical protein F6K18_11850 [Okeania sp. SIO2C2]|uniref:hypothetical protein n=1 Tax=Okeania sp. SIO2C2 TaxID=2607787 RepID=UPI0013B6E6B0|nr:hypothetical protein [Okeania sp. SIO2C2]NEP87462.1 hypothetical protein [Okeania sp. SIO2C2]